MKGGERKEKERMTKTMLFSILALLLFSLFVNLVAAVTPVDIGDYVVSDYPLSTYSYVVYGGTDPPTEGVTVVVAKGTIWQKSTKTDKKGDWSCKLDGSYPALKGDTIIIAIGTVEVEYTLTSTWGEIKQGSVALLFPFTNSLCWLHTLV